MNQIIPQFDTAFKQIPKTISFREDQKPVALQDYLIKFQQKIEHRKESLLNRYLREIQKIKAEFINTAKKATSKSIEFIEDSQQLEQRFKRQLSIRKRSNLDAIESLQKHQQNEINLTEIQEKNLQIKNNEQNRIISMKQNELATLKLQIEHLKQEINDQIAQNQNSNDDIIEKKKESNQQKIIFLKNQKNDEIDLIKKQIETVRSNIQLVSDRISNLKQSQIEMKNSFQSIIDHFTSQLNQQTQLKISQINDEIQSNQNMISSLEKKIKDPIVPLNQESFELELKNELNKRDEKIKFIEKNKRIEFESQILQKINEQHSILKEILQIESKTEIIKEKVGRENQIRIENLKNENQKEIIEINNELTKQRNNYFQNYNDKSDIIRLQAKLTDINIRMNKLNQEENDFIDLKNKKGIENVCSFDEIDDFFFVSDSFLRKEINNNNKIHLVVSKLNGKLDQTESICKQSIELNNLKIKNDIFEQLSLFESKESESCFNKINKEKEDLFKIENKSNNLFLSIESVFEIIDELKIKIELDENEDKKEKERLKMLIFELKEKQKNEIKKLHSLFDNFNDNLSNQLKNFDSEISEFIEKINENEEICIRLKSKEIDFIKKTENEINNLHEKNLKEIEDDDKILYFLKRKEIEKYYEPIINLIKERNHFLEELMRFKLKIKKREMINVENDEELILQLKSEISILEKHINELEMLHSHHVNRKAPLPPLKDS